MKKRRFEHQVALTRERDLAFKGVLAMVGKKPHQQSDGSVAIFIGNCRMGSGTWASFQNHVEKKLKQMGYFVSWEDQNMTSQLFPLTPYQTTSSGFNGIRIRYCAEFDIHIHRDIMAGENMADKGFFRILGVSHPHLN